MASQYFKGATEKLGRDSIRDCRDGMRGKGFKWKDGRFRLDIRNTFFTVRVVRHGHRLPREVVDTSSLKLP